MNADDFQRPAIDLRLLPAAALCWMGCWWVIARPLAVGVVLTGACLLVVLIASHRLAKPPQGRHRRPARDRLTATVLLTGVLACAVLGLATVRTAERQAALADQPADLVGVVRPTAEPQPITGSGRGHRYRVPARLLAVHDSGSAREVNLPVVLLTDEAWGAVPVGTSWWMRARLAPTSPGDRAAALLIVETGAHLHEQARWHDRAVNALRGGLVRASGDLAPQARGLVPGITLGDTRGMPPGLGEDLRAVSLTHITAVSGMHVAIVLGAVLVCLWWAPPWLRAGLGGLVLVAFAVLVYPSGSVVRAGVMGGLLLLGLATGRPRSSIPALLAAVVVLLGFDPWLARDFGFVLSVVATGGLLALAPVFAHRLRRFCPEPVAMGAAVSASAQLVCAPVLLLLAPGLPTHGILANVLATPAVPPATLLGVAATIAGVWWPATAASLAGVAAWFTAWIATVATFCAGLPLAMLPWPEGTTGAVSVGVAALGAGVWWGTRR
ncbi:MAG TPA: ComEC/Rec2 family competence protein [Beutenbergiaceae bacterium]|nr:ComEC/Rec2 family competence protein [Beutenbergiaceae bacterium]